ncbi:Hypothetical predicted protein, partial [Olea europaea subsp. europaea]
GCNSQEKSLLLQVAASGTSNSDKRPLLPETIIGSNRSRGVARQVMAGSFAAVV